jgi:hypothetical protein
MLLCPLEILNLEGYDSRTLNQTRGHAMGRIPSTVLGCVVILITSACSGILRSEFLRADDGQAGWVARTPGPKNTDNHLGRYRFQHENVALVVEAGTPCTRPKYLVDNEVAVWFSECMAAGLCGCDDPCTMGIRRGLV